MQKRLLSMVVLLMAWAVVWSQNAPKAPTLPESIHKSEHEQLTQVMNHLSKGEFDKAVVLAQGTTIPNTIQVYGSWATIPMDLREAFKQAAIQAVENWNRALNGNPKLEWTNDEAKADIQIVFEEDVAEITAGQFRLMHGKARLNLPPASGQKRQVRARIATYIPYTEMAMSANAISHLVGQAVGTYLGLAESQKDDELMGPVWNTENLPTAPTAQEVERVRTLLQVRAQLLDYANRRTAVYLAKPRFSIDVMEHDFGEITQGSVVKHTFKIRNTGDAPLEITARPSCGCVVPKYDNVIAPGQEGSLEAQLSTAGFRGAQIKTIQITSNDPDNPSLTLRLTANIRTAIEVRPSETIQMRLSANAPTTQEVELIASTSEPLEIQQVNVPAPYAKAEVQKIDDKRAKIVITVQPDAPAGRSNFLVLARTNLQAMPQVTINVVCEKGIIVTPTTVFFGAIGSATPLPIERTVLLSRSDTGFKILKYEVDDPNIEVRHESDSEGKQHRVIMRYKGGWTQGTIRRTLTVETDDPQQPRITVSVMANVLPSGI